MNIISETRSRPAFRLPYGRSVRRPATPAAATLSSCELKQIVAAVLG
ncbi:MULTISPECIES: hypothetical protein [Sphingobium]|nr:MULTISPECIES: hypothetical protein [Sphingobium]MBJ7375315.1 hypothetical protein [Sphingobium sp.]WCP15622.1 hypothetical protein sphantq_04100 [Sphingobium sp. AntQ-1]